MDWGYEVNVLAFCCFDGECEAVTALYGALIVTNPLPEY